MERKELRKEVIEHLKELLEEEISEAGSRIVKAIIAEEEGLTEAASALREVAYDEAKHALLIASSLPEKVFGDTRNNIMSSIDADSDAATREKHFAQLTRDAGMDEVSKLFEQLSIDETEHVNKLRKALASLKPDASMKS